MLWHISGGFLPAPVSCAGHVALLLLLLISMVRRFGLVVKLFGEQRVDPCLGDGFVDFRCGATAGHRSNGLAVYFDRHSTLIGEGVREHEDLHAAGFELIGGGFGRASIKCGVAGLFLGELDGVESGAVGLLEEKQVAAFVDDAYGHLHVSLVRFRFRRSGYCFNGRQIQPFPAGKFDGAG